MMGIATGTISLRNASSPAEKKDAVATSINRSTAHAAQTSGIHQRIQHATNYAVAQAQQEEFLHAPIYLILPRKQEN
ncbi:hypothetical protein F0562_009602 [Nyssa sinensis]|uniref:Uncharacterized protein n=1 Tax=Nyssa sinensis TaxID=561372 RepID=A0A5J4ZYR5_9ASTE|nr:hypothetical protein F0562_009602 [Nyssa sinensis]